MWSATPDPGVALVAGSERVVMRALRPPTRSAGACPLGHDKAMYAPGGWRGFGHAGGVSPGSVALAAKKPVSFALQHLHRGPGGSVQLGHRVTGEIGYPHVSAVGGALKR